jgi:hypothetical protein
MYSRLQKTALASAVTMALGTAGIASADQYSFSFTNADATDTASTFLMLQPDGGIVSNGDSALAFGLRTQAGGTLTWDTDTGTGTMAVDPFSFFGNGIAAATGITLQAISGGSGKLILGNMGFNWNNNNGIPVSIVWDAQGMLDAIAAGGLSTGSIVTGGAVPAGNNASFFSQNIPIGPAPLATTTWDTTDIGPNTLGTNPSGTLPLVADTVVNTNVTTGSETGIGGSPMVAGPFGGNNSNFDFTTLTVTSFADTTPPVITLNGTDPVDINVGDTYNEAGASCTDAVDGNLDGSVVIGGDTVPDPATAGAYTVTYNCQDNSLNDATEVTRTVNVTAAGTPVITLIGSTPVTHEAATPYTDQGANCDDPEDGSISPLNGTFTPPQDFSSISTVNENVPGAYTVTYNCTDTDNITALQVVRDVDVVDTIGPDITLDPACGTGANAITHIADGTDPTPAASAIDAVDGTVPVTQGGDTVDPDPNFGSSLSITYNLSYTATDAASNSTIQACQIVQGNPDPVATLNGNATVVVASGADYTEEGATCADFTDGALPDATPDMTIDGSTPNGTYTITYTCGPNTLGNTGTTTRTVIVGTSFSAASDSGSNFTMINPSGDFVGGATDIFASWDGSMYTTNDPANQPENLFMNSAEPQPFFGFPWFAHDVRAFGPGSYTFNTSRGNTLSMVVAEDQIGAHMLFDWNNNNDIDVALVWDINAVFAGAPGKGDNGAKGQTFTLAVIDTDGDGSPGIPGIPMADGPFAGFNANFNLKLTPQYALPDTTATAAQGVNDPASGIAPTTPSVVITATVDPNINGVASYAGPFTYDWSTSDASLLAVDDGNTSSSTYTFDPTTLPEGGATARVKATDGTTGLTSTVEVPLRIAPAGATLADTTDTDADGIIDINDGIDNIADPTSQQVVAGAVVTPANVARSSAGTLILGDTAMAVGASTGVYQMSVSETDIGVVDSDVAGSCVGGCFSYKISGLTPEAAVDIILPLSAPIPADAGVRKFVNDQWRNFETDNGNAIMSAPLAAGQDCAQLPTSAFRSGAVEGDECLKVTVVDGGVNDADVLANGTVVDPIGVSGASTVTTTIPPTVQSPNTGGGCTLGGDASAWRFTEWWLISGLLGWLGLTRRNRSGNTL